MSDLRIVYVTAASAAEAEAIGRAAVERRLAACANILPQMRAIYRWGDAIETGDEVVLLLKTTDEHIFELISAIERLHSYATPCVLVFPIAAAATAFGDWVRCETGIDKRAGL